MRWYEKLKRVRRTRAVAADVEKFHDSFELFKKYLQAQDADVNQDVNAAAEAGEDLERFISELVEQQLCQ
jgi:hypothetical protein